MAWSADKASPCPESLLCHLLVSSSTSAPRAAHACLAQGALRCPLAHDAAWLEEPDLRTRNLDLGSSSVLAAFARPVRLAQGIPRQAEVNMDLHAYIQWDMGCLKISIHMSNITSNMCDLIYSVLAV